MPRLDLELSGGLVIPQVVDFTFTDDATPLGIDDSSGSTGTMNVTIDRHGSRPATMKALRGQGAILSVIGEERMVGRVSHVTGTDTTVGIDIDSLAIRLAVIRSVKPFVGRLDDALVYWAGLCSVPAGSVEVDPAIAAQQVALLVGFHDNVWLRLKQLCAATSIEVVVRDDALIVRPPRAVVISTQRATARSWDVDDTSMAQSIVVDFYDPASIVAGDYTVDYSRSNVDTSTSDDAGNGLIVANAPANQLPPGWYRKVIVE